MKKYLNIKKLVILIIICSMLLVSCKSNKNAEHGLNPENPVTITAWHYYNSTQKTSFDDLIIEFNETVGKEKGIVVEAFSQGGVNDLIKMLNESAMHKVGSSNMPDLFTTYVDTAKEIDDLGLLASLDNYFTKDELSEYISYYLDEGRFDENKSLKIIPAAKSTEVLMINKTDWDKFSSETDVTIADLTTWEDIEAVAEKYYDYSGGKAFMGRDVMANYILIGSNQLGHELFQIENGNYVIDLDKAVLRKIWNSFYVPFVNGYYGKYGRFASDDAKTGDVIAYVGSSSGSTFFPTKVIKDDNATSYPIELMVLPLPNFEGTEKMAVQQGAGFGVTKSTETKEYACTVFLKWLTEEENNMVFSAEAGYMPVKTKANNFEYLKQIMYGKGILIDENVQKTLQIAMEQSTTYKLYTSKALKNGTEIRKILEETLINKSIEDKEKINAEISEGGNRSDIVQKYSDLSFESWFNELDEMLKSTINN